MVKKFVGMGEIAVGKAPDILTTVLGSCVAVIVYSPQTKAGGIAHVMLPYPTRGSKEVGKFASTAVPALVKKVKAILSSNDRLFAKLVGGAVMLSFGEDSFFNDIGEKNARVSREILEKYHIPVVAEDIGGSKGRRVEFDLNTGDVIISVFGVGKRVI